MQEFPLATVLWPRGSSLGRDRAVPGPVGSGPRYQILSHVFARCASQKTHAGWHAAGVADGHPCRASLGRGQRGIARVVPLPKSTLTLRQKILARVARCNTGHCSSSGRTYHSSDRFSPRRSPSPDCESGGALRRHEVPARRATPRQTWTERDWLSTGNQYASLDDSDGQKQERDSDSEPR